MSTSSDQFSEVATAYDREFSRLPEVIRLRARIHELVQRYVRPGGRILDLGCGTGEDSVGLCARGFEMFAADSAGTMLEAARANALAHGCALPLIQMAIDRPFPFRSASFDAIFSNFGGLNSAEELNRVFRNCAALLRTDGTMIICFLNHHSLWEVLPYLFRGRIRQAYRRWRCSGVSVPAGRAQVLSYYHAVREIKLATQDAFRLQTLVGLNILTPPPSSRVSRKERAVVFPILRRCERSIESVRPFSRLGDQFVIVLQHRGVRRSAAQ
jgi:SAM-dependent methyltransferase